MITRSKPIEASISFEGPRFPVKTSDMNWRETPMALA